MTLPSYTDPPFAVAPDVVVLHFSEPPPSLNNLYVNVSGRGRVMSKHGKQWRELAGHELNRQHPRTLRGLVNIEIAIADKGRSDLDGKAKAAIDLLVGHGVIEQDDRSVVREIRLSWDASITGCRVTVRASA